MVAGALLLAAVWVFLLRYVPDVRSHADTDLPDRPQPVRPAAGLRPEGRCGVGASCWCSDWWAGGSSPAACSRRSRGSPTPHAWPRTVRCRTGSGWRAATTSSASSPTLRHHARPARGACRGAAAIRGQRLARVAHAARDHADPARRRPQRPRPRRRRAHRATPRRQHPGDRAHRSTAAAQPRRPAFVHPGTVDLSLLAEEATETLLPLAEKHGVTIETTGDVAPTIGSHALLLQMTTNLVHNAIVHNLPEHGTVHVDDRRGPGPSRSPSRTPARAPPAPGHDAHRAVPARHRTRPHRPRRVGLGLAIVRASPRRTTAPSPSPLDPRAGSASRCNYRLHHRRWTRIGATAAHHERGSDGPARISSAYRKPATG